MSLIVFGEGALYADNRFVIQTGGINAYISDKKIFRDPNNHFAVAVCGTYVPPSVMKEMMDSIATVALMHNLVQTKPDGGDVFKKMAQEIAIRMPGVFKSNGSTFLVMTKFGIFRLDNIGYTPMNPEEDTVIGSGNLGFFMMRRGGFSIEQSYAAVNSGYNTVGPLSQMVKQSELEDWSKEEIKAKEKGVA